MADPPESLALETRRKWSIPNELRYERNSVSLRAARDLCEGLRPEIRFRSISNTYNCIGMVVASRRVSVDPAHLLKILKDDGYQQLPGPEGAQQGDVVVYQDDLDEEPTHVAIVLAKCVVVPGGNDDSLLVLSKWGHDGEYEHKSRYVPDVYGRPTQYWTDRRNP